MNNKIFYPFSHPLVFAMVMQDDPIKCRQLIERIIPDRKVRDIRCSHELSAESEKTIINGLHSKSVRLDVLFEDDDAWYDIEMQVNVDADLPKRSRYYHASIDSSSLKKGKKYKKLKPCYVIFLCLFDPFHKGKNVYFFEKYDKNSNLPLNDDSYTIIVNTACNTKEVSAALKPLIKYLQNGKIEAGSDTFVDEVHQKVMELNQGEDLVTIMTLEEELELRYDAGIEKGIEQRNLEIAKVMKSEGEDTEKICKFTGLSKEIVATL